jgi:hypothetical protein
MTRTHVLPPLPVLNTIMIFDLIRWAELSESGRGGATLRERFPNWGVWDQSNWASLTNETPAKLDLTTLPRVPTEAEGGVCNTSYCMAGQAVTQSDYRLVYNSRIVEGRETVYAETAMPQRPSGQVSKRGWAIWEDVPGAHAVAVEFAGAQVLGLTPAEADLFFGGDNGIYDLKIMVNRFALARGLPFLFPDEVAWDDYDVDDVDDPRLDYGNYAEPSSATAATARPVPAPTPVIPVPVAQASIPTPV